MLQLAELKAEHSQIIHDALSLAGNELAITPLVLMHDMCSDSDVALTSVCVRLPSIGTDEHGAVYSAVPDTAGHVVLCRHAQHETERTLCPHATAVDSCFVCGGLFAPTRLVVCEGCERTWHTFCCSPPLEDVPTGGWTCALCNGCHQPPRMPTPIVRPATPAGTDAAPAAARPAKVKGRRGRGSRRRSRKRKGKGKGRRGSRGRKKRSESDEDASVVSAKTPRDGSDSDDSDGSDGTGSHSSMWSESRPDDFGSSRSVSSDETVDDAQKGRREKDVHEEIIAFAATTGCVVCAENSDFEHMILCDGCDKGQRRAPKRVPIEPLPLPRAQSTTRTAAFPHCRPCPLAAGTATTAWRRALRPLRTPAACATSGGTSLQQRAALRRLQRSPPAHLRPLVARPRPLQRVTSPAPPRAKRQQQRPPPAAQLSPCQLQSRQMPPSGPLRSWASRAMRLRYALAPCGSRCAVLTRLWPQRLAEALPDTNGAAFVLRKRLHALAAAREVMEAAAARALARQIAKKDKQEKVRELKGFLCVIPSPLPSARSTGSSSWSWSAPARRGARRALRAC